MAALRRHLQRGDAVLVGLDVGLALREPARRLRDVPGRTDDDRVGGAPRRQAQLQRPRVAAGRTSYELSLIHI